MKKWIGIMMAAFFCLLFCASASASDAIEEALAFTGLEEFVEEFRFFMQRNEAAMAQSPSALMESDSTEAMKAQEELVRKTFLDMGFTEKTVENPISDDIPDEVLALAYQDLAQAGEQQKQQILAARQEVISNSTWSVDEVVSYGWNYIEKTFEFSPKFSDLFPGWEVPVNLIPQQDSGISEATETENDESSPLPTPRGNDEAEPAADSGESEAAPQMEVSGNGPWEITCTLDSPSTSAMSSDVLVIPSVPKLMNTLFTSVWAGTFTNPNTTTWNLGYRNRSTGASLDSWLRLPLTNGEGRSVAFNGTTAPKVGVRVSTFSVPTPVRIRTERI